MPTVQVPSHMVMSAMATGGALCSNTDMGENEGKKVQYEGISLPIVDRSQNLMICIYLF